MTTLINPGCFIRRKLDEVAYRPMVGLIHADGLVDKHYLDTSGDKFSPINWRSKAEEDLLEADELMEELSGAKASTLDFRESVIQYLNSRRIKPEIQKLVLEALETK